MASDILVGHSKTLNMKSDISIHAHVHTLIMASYWMIATAALGRSDKY